MSLSLQSTGTAAAAEAFGIPEATIASILSSINAAIIFDACCLAIALWDWIVCLPLEYKAIWQARNSLVKVIYFASRVLILFANSWMLVLWQHDWTRDECGRLYRSQPGVYLLGLVLASILLFMRAYAVSRHAAWVAALGAVLVAGEVAMDIFITVRGLQPVPVFSLDQKGYCVAGGGPLNNVAVSFWVFPLLNALVATAIMIFYVRRYARSGSSSGLLSSLISEGLQYFLVIAVVNSLNIGFFSQTSWLNSGICAPLDATLTAIMSCRLVLSLHKSGVAAQRSSRGGAKDSFWAGRSAVMDPFSGGMADSAERRSPTFNLRQPGTPQLISSGADSVNEEKTQLDSDAPFAVSLVPARGVRIQSETLVHSDRV